MIYRSRYYNKEARQAYMDSRISLRRRLSLSLFMGLVSFAVYFVLQTLKESVLSDAAPELMQPSYFSTLYIYIHTALLGAAAYYIVYYDHLFFTEIRRNAWYLLIQMGYRPGAMIAAKLAALLFFALVVYTAGFVITALLTVFLKYTFVSAYMPALWLAGLTDVLLLTVASLTLSLFVKSAGDARLGIAAAAVGVLALKALTGAYGILRNRVTMQEFGSLFDTTRSWYFPAAAALLLAGTALAALRAARLARYYSPPAPDAEALPEGIAAVRMDGKILKQHAEQRGQRSRRRKLLNAAVTALLIAVVSAALALNVLIILISTSTPGSEVTIRGTIPYVFQSDTMQPSIAMNDLVFFRKVDVQYPLAEDQIVLFTDDSIVYVERVTEITGDVLKVDIDSYPSGAEAGAMRKEIPRSAVYGVYAGRNRWLGALILFSNTIIGRIVFLLVPAVLLFFRGPIAARYKKSRGA